MVRKKEIGKRERKLLQKVQHKMIIFCAVKIVLLGLVLFESKD